MEKSDIVAFRDAVPFVPFDLRIADGRLIRIPHPDYVMVSPMGNFVAAFLPSGGFVNIAMSLVVDVSPHRDVLHMLFDTADA